MEVTWLGGTAFRLRGRDAAVATDPHTSGIKQRSARPKADLVTLGDPAAGVAYDDLVRPNKPGRTPFVADGPGEYEVAGVYVHGVAEHNGAGEPATTLYTIEIDRLNVGVFSRLTEEPSDALLDELGGLHVLLINVDGGSTGCRPSASSTSSTESSPASWCRTGRTALGGRTLPANSGAGARRAKPACP